jgi:hypothetical protein
LRRVRDSRDHADDKKNISEGREHQGRKQKDSEDDTLKKSCPRFFSDERGAAFEKANQGAHERQ